MFDVCDNEPVTSDHSIIDSGGWQGGQTGKSSVLVSRALFQSVSIHEAVGPGGPGYRAGPCVPLGADDTL